MFFQIPTRSSISIKKDGKENKLEFRKRLEKLQQRVQEDFVKKQMDIDFLIGIGKVSKDTIF